jgi:PAS domain S-box-containing protein
MTGHHDFALVALSIAIAVAASFTALDLAGRLRASAGWSRRVWLAAAALAMGGGIWSMHFVAMLAFNMPGMIAGYDAALTLFSLLVAVVVTGIAFAVMNYAPGSPVRLAGAGVFMGLGVVAMHYIGMAAMKMPADLHYDPRWVAASVAIAVGAATAALWLAARNSELRQRAVAALVMGAAVSGMHYAAMQGATFIARPGQMHAAGRSVGQVALALSVSSAAFLILFLALVAAMFDRRFALLAEREAVALRKSEERFRSLYRGTPLPLHSLDRDGRIEQVSNTWLRLLGYGAEEVIGRPLINFMTESSARQMRQTDWPELIASDALDPREYRIVTKDGVFLDVVAAATVERDDEGRFLHVLGGLTNITERKRAEDALRQAQKIEAIGQLTGGIAHDFNNLLAVVIGNLELLKKRVPDDPRVTRLLASAQEGAQRGAALTQRLLAFARRQDLRPEPVDVPALVRGMSDLLQRSLGPMVLVETRFPLGLPHALVDAHQLELALLNLAVNARDAMPNGGALAIAAIEAAAPAGGELAPGRYLKLTLADQGEGMDADTLARAMEPFFTTKGVGKGTGLGLSMVQGLAAQSGGRLVLASTPGQGTTAELWLPAAEPAAPRIARADADALPLKPMVERLVLVVDDDPLVLANTATQLEDLGHRVVQAGSAREALARIGEGLEPDIVVTDQLMPLMTGMQLVDELRALRPGLPVLLVSGFSDLPAEAGGDIRLLRKPFTQRQLAEAMAGSGPGAAVIPFRKKRD